MSHLRYVNYVLLYIWVCIANWICVCRYICMDNTEVQGLLEWGKVICDIVKQGVRILTAECRNPGVHIGSVECTPIR